jgi:hypothetical protein
MATTYPTIANCNYESDDDDTIHRARLADENLLDSPEALTEALEVLETVLDEELTEGGEHRRGQLSAEAIDSAEADVISAYGDGPGHAMWVDGRWRASDDSGARW